jgi:hypothetical protein
MIPANNKHSTKTLSIDRRHFNEAERRFVASGEVPAAARAAAPKSEAENQAMFAAEEEVKDRAKESALAPTEANSPPATVRT